MSEYVHEFRTQWRALASATIGLSCGLILNSYVAGIMGPHLLAQFGWTKSQLASVQVLSLFTVVAFPVVGRMADIFGGRRTALVGIVTSPLLFLGFSQVTSFAMYAALFGAQVALLTTTTPPIYFRVIVQNFRKARGMALALAIAGPSLVAAIGGPLLNNLVVAQGWQAGYLALMAFSAAGGLLAYLMMPFELRANAAPIRKRPAREDFAAILRHRVFWVLAVSMLLCNLPQAIILSQLNLILSEFGVTGRSASIMVSSYAIGMMVGRFISGYALDRFPPRIVATLGLLLSGFGILGLGLTGGSIIWLSVAVLAIGLSFGAESDIIAFLIYRHFGGRIYSTVHGLTSSMVAISATIGAALLSFILHVTDAYLPFLMGTGLCVLAGGLLLLLLPRNGIAEGEEAAASPEPQPAAP